MVPGLGRRVLLATALLFGLLASGPALAQPTLGVEVSGAALSGAKLHLELTVAGAEGDLAIAIFVDGRKVDDLGLGNGEHAVVVDDPDLDWGNHSIEIRSGTSMASAEAYALPGWTSLLPPLVAICLAILFKDVLLALFLGVFTGALALFGLNPFRALARSMDTFVVPAATDPSQATILIFTLLLGGMVGLVTKSGGTQGIVVLMSRFATNAIRGQVATWMMGVLIFFDDYSNALIVGSTMRPLSDRLRISREKLAYIVDSTAAPVACVVPFSSWVGFEVGLIGASLAALSLPFDAYGTFLDSIPFRFYPLFAIVLVFTLAVTGRDLGPMARAERRARKSGKLMDDDAKPLAEYASDRLSPPEGTPLRAVNAFVPILAIIGVTLYGLYITGSDGLVRAEYPTLSEWIRGILNNADSYKALLWASLAGTLSAALLPLVQRILTLRETMEAMVEGFKSMLLALTVLTLAWSLGGVCSQMHTADFLVQLAEGMLAPQFIPALIFVLAAIIAFATGSSWGTMSILTPLVIPISHALSTQAGMEVGSEPYMAILLGTVSSVLAGSVWGDHCSPISDTTILSSTATGCDHIAHVRTQMPYALSVGLLGIAVGDIPTAFGISPYVSLLAGTIVIVVVVRLFGKPAVEPATA